MDADGNGKISRAESDAYLARAQRMLPAGWEQALHPEPCVNATCGCHIGYVHLNDLNLYAVFGEGVLERIPANQVSWRGR